jgi:hypothetical protein
MEILLGARGAWHHLHTDGNLVIEPGLSHPANHDLRFVFRGWLLWSAHRQPGKPAMNTARWAAWVAMLKQSDATLVQLATMAAAAVLIWESLRRVAEPWQGRLRSAYLLGLLILFVYLLGGQMDIIGWSIAIGIVMFVVGGSLATWQAISVQRVIDQSHRADVAREESLAQTQPCGVPDAQEAD